MSSPKQASSNVVTNSAAERLARYSARNYSVKASEIIPLTPDASTLSYFRLPWKKGTAIAAVYPEPFDPEFHPYLDITRLFLEADIPVPETYAVDGEQGIIV